MSLIVGVDDTDSPEGMCTTYLGLMLATALSADLDLIGHPRLVRLNPNVPWKTRGNGAVALVVGAGEGEPFTVGMADGRPILAYPRGEPAGDPETVLETAAALVECLSSDHPDTRPGVVVSPDPPSPEMYWRAVRDVVHLSEVVDRLDAIGALHRGWNGGRGVIGAAAAAAWPAADWTFEATTYRRRERWGTPREVDLDALAGVDAQHGTFSSFDPETGRALAVPNTPCPVLLGLRAEWSDTAEAALAEIPTEEPAGRITWMTNHATDDHLTPVDRIADVRPTTSVIATGRIVSAPRRLRGGHVIASIGDGTGSVDIAAYEPTGRLRQIVAALAPGDAVTAVGGVRSRPLTINLERIEIVSTVDRYIKLENPVCHSCGVHMKSRGRDAGYRCARCGATAPEEAAVTTVATAPEPGWYEAALSAQRHLTMPSTRGARWSYGGVLRRDRAGGHEDL